MPSRRRADRADDPGVLGPRVSDATPGRDCTKSEIVEHVWDSHFDGDLNVVEVHISALRRKIDLPFGTETIRTVRGSGYRVGVA